MQAKRDGSRIFVSWQLGECSLDRFVVWGPGEKAVASQSKRDGTTSYRVSVPDPGPGTHTYRVQGYRLGESTTFNETAAVAAAPLTIQFQGLSTSTTTGPSTVAPVTEGPSNEGPPPWVWLAAAGAFAVLAVLVGALGRKKGKDAK